MEKKYLSVKAHQIEELNRCKFRLWHSFKMGVNLPSLLKEEFKELIVSRGIRRETEILEKFPWETTTKKYSELIKEAKAPAIGHPLISTIITFPDYSSTRPKVIPVRLIGIPDLLIKNSMNPRDRYYRPVEVKAHKRPQLNDFRRILFYSLIMRKEFYPKAGFRKTKASKNHGFLWLNSKDRKESEEYKTPAAEMMDLLETKDFDEVPVKRVNSSFDWDFKSYQFSGMHYDLMSDIGTIANLQRKTQEPLYSIEPILCSECSKCTLREECSSVSKNVEDLSIVHGIGRSIRSLFIECDCKSLKDVYELGECWKKKPNVKKVEEALTKKFGKSWESKFVGYWKLERILRGIKANVEERIVAEKLELPSGKAECFLDLEYDESKRPFCIGMKIREGSKSKSYQWFVDKVKQSSKVINKAREILEKKKPVIYVYAGKDAEILGLGESCIDLYQRVLECVAFPLKSYGLKSVAKYLGYEPPEMSISDGLECLAWYARYRREKDEKEREKIKQEILDYNMNDVESLEYLFDTFIANKS